MRTSKTSDAAYVAGYIDADGTIRLGRRKKLKSGKVSFVVCVVISGVNRDALDWMKERYGGYVGPHSKAGDRGNGIVARKPCFAWQISALKATAVLRLVRPFLIVKKRQCEIALKFADYVKAHRACTGRPLPLDYREVCEDFQQQIRRFNTRGVSKKEG